jgi:hypothetical protein
LRVRSRRGCRRRRTALLLQGLQLLAELLIAVLQLLDLAGQIADGPFEAIEPRDEIGGILGARGRAAKRALEKCQQGETSEPDLNLRHVHYD